MAEVIGTVDFEPQTATCRCGTRFSFLPRDIFTNMYGQQGITCPNCKDRMLANPEKWKEESVKPEGSFSFKYFWNYITKKESK